MGLFINRTLNLKQIKAIGFDMDHTLVRYHVKNFEEFSYHQMIEKLILIKGYPKEIKDLSFEYHKSIQGLVIDKKHGNILKLNRYGKVKQAYHGEHKLPFKEMVNLYRGRVVELTDQDIQSLDTNFSISNGVMYLQLVELKKKGLALPAYEALAHDLREILDLCHRDGSIKREVAKNKSKYLIRDPDVVKLMKSLKQENKKVMVITNSDINYTMELLNYTIDPYLDSNERWYDLFDLTITLARKPAFFSEKNDFLKIDPVSLNKIPFNEKIETGIFEGGNARKLQEDLSLFGEDFLYFGDHIYGDVVALKKALNWRTALVLDPLIDELDSLQKTSPIQKEIDLLMKEKVALELLLESSKENEKEKISKLNDQLSTLIHQYHQTFNSYWGELMRAGSEESRFADQVEKYACIYMTTISELGKYSPRHYFRPKKRKLPHE